VLCRSGHLLRIPPDLGFDSKITARYAARVAELESRGHLLIRFQRRRRGLDKTRHACLSTKQNTACAPPCGAIPAQATSTPSLGAWSSIPHHHTLLVVRVTSTVISAVPVPAIRWFVMHSSVSTTAAVLSTLSLYVPSVYFDISDILYTTCSQNNII